MSFENIIVGDYGQVAKITVIDVDTNVAADISGYSTTIQMIFTNPSGVPSTKTAAFDSDGSDGIIKYTIEAGLFNAAGNWRVRGRVKNGTATLSTVLHSFQIQA